MYCVQKRKVAEHSKGCIKLVEKIAYITVRGRWGPRDVEWGRRYVFNLIDQGDVIESMDARDVYAQYPTHYTYEQFIAHWLADQNMLTMSTLNLDCIFSQVRPVRRASNDFERDDDNNEKS
jgi:hypothetical protein